MTIYLFFLLCWCYVINLNYADSLNSYSFLMEYTHFCLQGYLIIEMNTISLQQTVSNHKGCNAVDSPIQELLLILRLLDDFSRILTSASVGFQRPAYNNRKNHQSY